VNKRLPVTEHEADVAWKAGVVARQLARALVDSARRIPSNLKGADLADSSAAADEDLSKN